ncbi:MAG: hypothetical protein U5M51_02420 [Emticicia sp.]|nr:hypothetical protein [Emticicia sp.]
MNWNQRRLTNGRWFNMETKWANALSGKAPYTSPQKVKVDITIKYGDNKRPVGFNTTYTIGNERPQTDYFDNF